MELDFLAGGGKMGELTRKHDWSRSTLGTPDLWPQSLRLMIRMILNTRHPMLIWWGPDLIQFYNDSYAETMGPERHPGALGQNGRECWNEIWHLIGPQIEFVMSGQGSTWDENRFVPVTRHGKRRDAWWTYSYGPIDEKGTVSGVIVICNDVTKQVLAAQNLKKQTRFLEQLFEQAPSCMAVLEGSDHIVQYTNQAFRRLLDNHAIVGHKLCDALPETVAQGFIDLLDQVYRSGVAYVGRAVPFIMQSRGGGPGKRLLLDFVYQPIVGADETTTGIFVEAVDVTDHVQAQQELREINLELTHRVRNTLAIISGIASQTLKSGNENGLEEFRERLSAFGKAHDVLAASDHATAAIRDVVHAVLDDHPMTHGRVFCRGPEVVLGTKQSLALSLALNELTVNAIRHGALSNDRGRVHITWGNERVQSNEKAWDNEKVLDEDMFHFSWHEIDGPIVVAPSNRNFGLMLVERGLAADFGGIVDLSYEPPGLVCRLRAPTSYLNFSQPRHAAKYS